MPKDEAAPLAERIRRTMDAQAAQTVTYRPIGVIHSAFKQVKGTPIQGVFAPDAQGEHRQLGCG